MQPAVLKWVFLAAALGGAFALGTVIHLDRPPAKVMEPDSSSAGRSAGAVPNEAETATLRREIERLEGQVNTLQQARTNAQPAPPDEAPVALPRTQPPTPSQPAQLQPGAQVATSAAALQDAGVTTPQPVSAGPVSGADSAAAAATATAAAEAAGRSADDLDALRQAAADRAARRAAVNATASLINQLDSQLSTGNTDGVEQAISQAEQQVSGAMREELSAARASLQNKDLAMARDHLGRALQRGR